MHSHVCILDSSSIWLISHKDACTIYKKSFSTDYILKSLLLFFFKKYLHSLLKFLISFMWHVHLKPLNINNIRENNSLIWVACGLLSTNFWTVNGSVRYVLSISLSWISVLWFLIGSNCMDVGVWIFIGFLLFKGLLDVWACWLVSSLFSAIITVLVSKFSNCFKNQLFIKSHGTYSKLP